MHTCVWANVGIILEHSSALVLTAGSFSETQSSLMWLVLLDAGSLVSQLARPEDSSPFQKVIPTHI